MSFIDKDRKMEINYIKSQGVHTFTVQRRSQRIPGIVFFKTISFRLFHIICNVKFT